MATIDISKVGNVVHITPNGQNPVAVTGTAVYYFDVNNVLWLSVDTPAGNRNYQVALSDLRLSGSSSAPASVTAAMTSLSTVFSSVNSGSGGSGAFVDVRDYGAVGDGTTNDYTAFINAIATGNHIYIPGGYTFLINPASGTNILTLSDGQKIFGDGFNSAMKTTWNGALLLVGNDCEVDNIRFIGSGKGTASKDLQTLIFSYQKRRSVITRCWLEGCAGTGSNIYYGGAITVSDVNPATPFYEGIKISNCNIYDNTVGVYFSRQGEYCCLTNSTISRNTTGVKLSAGNYNITNCAVVANGTGLSIVNDTNSGHGTIGNCQFNHNTTKAFDITGIAEGTTFTGCMFYYASAAITNSTGVKFIGCDFNAPSGGTYTFTNNTKTLFMGCRLTKTPTANGLTWTVASGEAPVEVNNFDF